MAQTRARRRGRSPQRASAYMWAPCGQTPVLRVPLTRDHLSAISGITLDGRLFMQVRPASYDAAAVVGFLRVLLRKLSGNIVVI